MSIAELLHSENHIEAITPRDPEKLVEQLKSLFGVKKVHPAARHFVESTAAVSLIKGPFRVKGMGSIDLESDLPGVPVGSANGCDFWLRPESGKVDVGTSDVMVEGVIDVTQLVELQMALYEAFGDQEPPRGPRYVRVVAGCFGGLTKLAKIESLLPPELLGSIDSRMLAEMVTADKRWTKVLRGDPAKVKIIDFSHARLTELPSLDAFDALEMINLIGNPDLDPQLVFEAVAPVAVLQRIDVTGCGWDESHVSALRELLPGCRVVAETPRGRPYVQAALRAGTPLTFLDLSDLGLKRLPIGVEQLTTLERIDLSGNPQLEMGPTLARLAALPSLRCLSLTMCGMRRLPEQVTKLVHLEELDLTGGTWGRHNQLKVDEVLTVVARLPKLVRLTLDGNRVPPGTWRSSIKLLDKHFRHLEHLGAADWVTSRNNGAGFTGLLQKAIGNMSQLQSLNLRGMAIGVLEDGLMSKPLRRLDISRNDIETLVPAELEDLEVLIARETPLINLEGLERCRKLEVLEVQGPAGPEPSFDVPSWLDWLSSLERLELSRLGFETLPESMGKLASLRDLTLSSKTLTHLPDAIGELKQLETLTLHELVSGCTSLEALPESIGGCESLRKLQIHNGGLRALPDTIRECDELEEVSLEGLRLRDPLATMTQLAALPKLSRLSLVNVGLNRVPEVLGECSSLTDVRIIDDFASHAQAAEMICSLEQLQRLDLSRFAIGRMPPAFANLTELRALRYETPRTTTVLSPEMLFAMLARLPCFQELAIDDLAGHWRELPSSIGDLTRLESLTLTSVAFRKLPTEMGRLHNLRLLHLDRCAAIKSGELRRLQRVLPGCEIRVTDW